MENIVERLLNPAVVASMVASGIAYGALLWALNIRPGLNLWITAIAPGVIFLAMIWTIRSMQGTTTLVYFALMVDWLTFAASGALTVLAARRWRGGK